MHSVKLIRSVWTNNNVCFEYQEYPGNAGDLIFGNNNHFYNYQKMLFIFWPHFAFSIASQVPITKWNCRRLAVYQ